MSESAAEQVSQGTEEINTQGQEQQQEQQQTGTSNVNPAWTELLDQLPSQLHSIALPVLQKYDKNHEESVGKVHSQYESFKPFLEQNIPAEQLNYGLQLLDAIQNRPQEVFESLKEYLQVEEEQPGQEQEVEQQGQNQPIDNIAEHPQFKQMSEMVNAMAQLLVQQGTQSQEQQEDDALEQEFADAKTRLGDFDEKYVMVQLLANDGMTIDQAVEEYRNFEKGILANANKPGPRVLSSGGSSINTATDPSKLDAKGRRNVVAEMLAANQQDQ